MLIAGCSTTAPASYPPAALFAPEAELPAPPDLAAQNAPILPGAPQPEVCAEIPPPAPACDSDTLRVSQDLAFHPQYALPPAEIRAELDRVASAMRAHPEWQLLRVEVYSGVDPGGKRSLARQEMDQSQRRADAILGYLFRKRRVSAERLDAIGYGFVQRVSAAQPATQPGIQPTAQPGKRWRVVLRLVHRLD